MAKLVKIDDRKFMEIFSGLKTMGPVELRLDETVIGRLLRSVNPPKNIYALNPKNHTQRVSLTLENYMTPENELFDVVKTEEIKKEISKEEETKNTLKNLMNTIPEPVVEKETPTVTEKETNVEISENTTPVEEIATEENTNVIEDISEGDFLKYYANKEETVVEVEENTVEANVETPTETPVPKEEPVQKPQQQKNYNYNKNYNKNNKHYNKK